MYKLLGGLKDYFKHQEIQTDNAVFRLHNVFTTVLLLTCSLIITATQYVGQPISCIVNGFVAFFFFFLLTMFPYPLPSDCSLARFLFNLPFYLLPAHFISPQIPYFWTLCLQKATIIIVIERLSKCYFDRWSNFNLEFSSFDLLRVEFIDLPGTLLSRTQTHSPFGLGEREYIGRETVHWINIWESISRVSWSRRESNISWGQQAIESISVWSMCVAPKESDHQSMQCNQLTDRVLDGGQ